MNPIDSLVRCARREPARGIGGCIAATFAGLLVMAALPTVVGAQRQPQAVPRAVPPPPVVAPISITIGTLPNISLPRESQGRLLSGSRQLPRNVRAALEKHGLVARIEDAKDSSFAFPSDDDLSFASFGEPNDEIVERIKTGYPELPVPFAFITLAERGQYLIAAAYVITEDAAGQKMLQRADRRIAVAKDISPETLLETWPGCMAAAIGRFVKNEKDAPKPGCQEGEGAAKPSTHAPAALPAKVASAASRGGEKDGGLLDGIPDDKPRVVNKEQLASSAPVRTPVQTGRPPPPPRGLSTPVTPSGPATPEASYQLIEQAFRFGIPCCHKKEKQDAVTHVMRRLIDGRGREGQCLKDFELSHFGPKSRYKMEQWMREALWQGGQGYLRGETIVAGSEYQIRTEPVPTESLSDSPRRCTLPQGQIIFTAKLFEQTEQGLLGSQQPEKRSSSWNPQIVGPPRSVSQSNRPALPTGGVEMKYDAAIQALDRANLDQQEEWIVPSTIEALAMADLLRSNYRSMRFWALADGRPAVISFGWEKDRYGEWFISDFNLKPNTDAAAVLIAIKRYYVRQ